MVNDYLNTKPAPEVPHRQGEALLLYTDANTRVRDLPVRFIRQVGIGRLIEVEVLRMWSHTYEEPVGNRTQIVTKEFHPGQVIRVDQSYTRPTETNNEER